MVRVHVHDGGSGYELGNLLVRPPGEGLLHLLQDVQPPGLGLRQGAPQQRRRETVALDVQLERRDACSIRVTRNGKQNKISYVYTYVQQFMFLYY